MKKLVIVESPAKSKTINKILGEGYQVTSSMGHLVDLPKSRMGVDIEHGFAPEYIVIPERKKYVEKLKKEAKEVKEIYLAPDPDREGEAISWHLSNLLGKGKKTYRVSFVEITKEAVLEAFRRPHNQIDMNKVNAQQARRIMDRLVGYSISPLLWKKVARGLSAGRVQSVAVRLVVEREREIESFVPQEYWEIEARLKKQTGDETAFSAKLDKIDKIKAEIKSQSEADTIIKDLDGKEYIVSDIKEARKKRTPPAPFTTSKLQQEAFNKLRYPVNRTMSIAQSLYEGVELEGAENVGLITYMRTDSVRISDQAQTAAKDFILKRFGARYYPAKPNIYKSKKNAQEAHEAIRPTVPLREPESVKRFLKPEQYKLYELIWNRFIASQMTQAQILATTVEIEAGKYLFKTSASSILFDGFIVLYAEEAGNSEEGGKQDRKIPPLSVGEKLDLLDLIPSEHFTKPPARYSDASLVKVLEEKGIGRPSTYAPIIYTIILRHYIKRESGYLYATELGIIVNDILVKHFPDVLNVKFTATMEQELDEVEEGNVGWTEVVNDFYQPFEKTLNHAKETLKSLNKIVIKTDQTCELCGRPMIIKWGRRGKFLSCSGFPTCKHAASISTKVKCPEPGCGGMLVERRSKNRGRSFYGCTNFPKCRHITNKLPKEDESAR